jgi:hypothetical protein
LWQHKRRPSGSYFPLRRLSFHLPFQAIMFAKAAGIQLASGMQVRQPGEMNELRVVTRRVLQELFAQIDAAALSQQLGL